MNRIAVLVLASAALALGAAACGGDGGAPDRTGGERSGQPGTRTGDGAPSRFGRDRDRRDGASSSTAPGELGERFRPDERDRKIQGDGSIERFGQPLPDDEAAQVVAAAVSYHDARARRDWTRACELLSSESRQTLEALAEQAPQLKGKDCAAVMGALSAKVPRAALAREAKGMRFNEVRVEGDQAFAIFTSKTIPHGSQSMVREDGQWRVAALSPNPL